MNIMSCKPLDTIWTSPARVESANISVSSPEASDKTSSCISRVLWEKRVLRK